MSASLRDYEFQISYGPADDRLGAFYIPALERSDRYDRSAGFFSSSALAVAAGIARLIQNGGRMRLLVGAQLDDGDVAAVIAGHDLRQRVGNRLIANLWDPEDVLLRRRLEALAWMIAAGTLELRVVLPTGPDGVPLPASVASDYYHPKEGIFTDADGDQIAFSGSVNESATAWVNNYEQFMVYRSWDSTRPYLAQVRQRFERLWEDREPDWTALPIPDAVHDRLLKFRPDQAPTFDPLERISVGKAVKEQRERHVYDAGLPDELVRSRLLIQFLRDAPFFPGARRLGATTSAVSPWPHQHRVADAIVARFPERFLIADEVGLGKTIEAGLAIRQLVISGAVRRCLILTPKSVQRQWQEELYEKFALDVPRYDGATFWTAHGQERRPSTENPFDAEPILLASSQLVKRRDRRDFLLAARPWDLVVVDEAHHARRKEFIDPRLRPNRLLDLLLNLKDRTRGLVLLTATPMQVHPIEVWDLLRPLGMGGRWGADPEAFLRFFSELRKHYDDIDWDFVFDMVEDFLATGGTEDGFLAAAARRQLGPVTWEQVRMLPSTTRRRQNLQHLSNEARPYVIEFAKRHTPLRRFVFRNTRSLLQDYRRRGLLSANIPRREPRPIWIEMLPAERELYDRIEEYIAHFYAKYEAERKGLGFIMTVYRRRLTSSFAAIEESLKRRLDFLRGLSGSVDLADDDLEEDDLDFDVAELLGDDHDVFQGEIVYVEDFLRALRQLSTDSKFDRLLGDLHEVFQRRDTVVIFTQYTDTMDDLRDRLREIYGGQVACYSGRGGERWRNGTWELTTKEEIKQTFRRGEAVKILLCTEAASEGLNLQSCGVLINYDMPWNPMRVEQRIGRIDRIGQRYETVWVRNYFYEATIEATVYQRLEDRIGWFQAVVGQLQPILSDVARSIHRLAMLPAAERRHALDEELSSLRQQLDDQDAATIHLDEFLESGDPEHMPTPVTLEDLERLFTRESELGYRFEPHAEIPGAYVLSWADRLVPVTFDPGVFDEHPSAVRFLTYGDDLFEELLSGVEAVPSTSSLRGLLRCVATEGGQRRAYFLPDRRLPVTRLTDLEPALTGGAPLEWTDESQLACREEFRRIVEADIDSERTVAAARRAAERRSLVERGRQVLLKAAMIETVLSRQPDFFDNLPMVLSSSEEAVYRLRRHAYPYKTLIKLVQDAGISGASLAPSHEDRFWREIQGLTPTNLRKRLDALKAEATTIVAELAPKNSGDDSAPAPEVASEVLTVPGLIYSHPRPDGLHV